MNALILNCSLKPSSQVSNTDSLCRIVAARLHERGATCTTLRVADLAIPPGVVTDLGAGDGWPDVHARIIDSEILVIASPTWLGHPSSLAQRVLERMDAMISEMRDGRPVAYGRVAGVVVTGNEDGAHHVISEICGGLIDIGYTIPPQAWTYWNRGPGPGPSYLETTDGHDWSARTGRQAADNLFDVASALARTTLRYDAG